MLHVFRWRVLAILAVVLTFGQISGQFTPEDADSLVIVQRSDASPARLIYKDAVARPPQEAQATRLDP